MDAEARSKESVKRGIKGDEMITIKSSRKNVKLIDKLDEFIWCNIAKEHEKEDLRKVHVVPGTINSEVKKTAFSTESHTLSHSLIICDGDLDLLLASNTKITWHEE